ncbi:phosphate signaling complex protein PhoU [Pontibacillus yanchengensis]|uniref:Phosphate signaling complex protein PhoU n=1 Tax=Pontibacillus yanchengensis TaxID=462910 RepID=A0ACC7VG46_9BACI|nr:phosphate signaling complex protein PhoU [Pontibacillus yanchengensis]MYL53757.1 phosphate signaling complex protein PhoU [Pontibacillus yanchengensis]
MIYREQFHQELSELKLTVQTMANKTSDLFQLAIDAFIENDLESAKSVLDRDEEINEMEKLINDKVSSLIAKQQPVASDLRSLVVAMKISSDLERMGDHAVNICKSTIRINSHERKDSEKVLQNIDSMKELALDMLGASMSAYRNEDIKEAKKLMELDEDVDEIHQDNYLRISKEFISNPDKKQVEHLLEYAFISRYIERFGDHVKNIGEEVFYLVKGETME